MGTESISYGGMTEEQHSGIAHTLAMLNQEAKRWGDLNRVKLPTPTTSDYITPSAATTSSHLLLQDDVETGSSKLNWEGLTDFSIDSASQIGGTYSIKVASSNADVSEKKNTIGTIAEDGDAAQIKIKIGSDTGTAGDCVSVVWLGGGYSIVRVAFQDTGAVQHHSGSTFTDLLPSWTAGTIYTITITFDFTNNQYDIDINGTTATNASFDNNGNNIEKINIKNSTSSSGATRNCYFDDYHYGSNTNYAIDDDTTTHWEPNPVNASGASYQVDMGGLKTCGGCRIYFPKVEYIPDSFKIQTSEDASTWTDVNTVDGTTLTAGAWNELSWPSRYARYLKIVENGYGGALGIRIGETDYYSRIVDRVASEHAHGSGVTEHLKGHDVRKGFTKRRELQKKANKGRLGTNDILEYLRFVEGTEEEAK